MPHLDDQSTIDPNVDPASAPSAAQQPQRRFVLKAAGLTALAGGGVAFLGACAADREAAGGATSAASSSAPSSAASSSAASPSAAESSASAAESSAAAPDGPSVSASDVPVESGVITDDYVVTQPAKGEFKAFSNICTHQKCKVTAVTSTIDCACHGSQFSVSDGSVVKGPATEALEEFTVEQFERKVYITG